jgi:trehalose 6-phosphate phosphatase
MVVRMSDALLPQWCDDWALFLDVDGTLLEIAATPEDVFVPARTLDMLAKLRARLGGALALVSGRTIADLDRLFAPLRLPTAGAHGAERRTASGQILQFGHAAPPESARRLLDQWVTANEGALLEDKGAALALHYRGAPALEWDARRVAAAAVSLAGPQYRIQEGKKVLEIKPHSIDKGAAIGQFMQEAPFAARVPVFIGDDLTDEHGFERVNELGGHSIAVGAVHATVARWRLESESCVLRWLESHT